MLVDLFLSKLPVFGISCCRWSSLITAFGSFHGSCGCWIWSSRTVSGNVLSKKCAYNFIDLRSNFADHEDVVICCNTCKNLSDDKLSFENNDTMNTITDGCRLSPVCWGSRVYWPNCCISWQFLTSLSCLLIACVVLINGRVYHFEWVACIFRRCVSYLVNSLGGLMLQRNFKNILQ